MARKAPDKTGCPAADASRLTKSKKRLGWQRTATGMAGFPYPIGLHGPNFGELIVTAMRLKTLAMGRAAHPWVQATQHDLEPEERRSASRDTTPYRGNSQSFSTGDRDAQAITNRSVPS